MLNIRKEQFDVCLQQNEEAFLDYVVRRVQDEHPSDAPADVLRRMVANGIKRARSHGLYTDVQLVTFVQIMFDVAPNFDQQRLLNEILKDESLTVDQRWDKLFEEDPEIEKAWDEADSPDFIDSDEWFPEHKEDDEPFTEKDFQELLKEIENLNRAGKLPVTKG